MQTQKPEGHQEGSLINDLHRREDKENTQNSSKPLQVGERTAIVGGGEEPRES